MSDNARASDRANNELTYTIGKGKKIYPLLLKGDTWLAVASIQYVDVRNRKLEYLYETIIQSIHFRPPAQAHERKIIHSEVQEALERKG